MAIDRLLFNDYFKGQDDTATLNAALENLYDAVDSSGDAVPTQLRVKTTSNKTITASVQTPITFDSKDYDTSGLWSGSKVSFTQSGLYLVTANVLWDADTTGTIRQSAIRKNGSTFVRTVSTPPASFSPRHNLAMQLKASVGDYIELVVFHNATTSRVVAAETDDSVVMEVVQLSS